jgi:hypothetical protein
MKKKAYDSWNNGMMEEWNIGRMVMTIGSFPIIPTFHHSNLPYFKELENAPCQTDGFL